MPTWEKILLGIAALLILLWFFPGVRAAMKHAPKGTADDWKGLLFPIGLVVLLVALLILSVR